MKRLALVLAALLACAGPAAAQRTPTYQGGAITPGDVAKFQANGPVTSAGTLLGDGTGRGVNPFAILDRNDLGLCSNNAVTGGQYNALCIGHDSSGNGILTLDSYGGLSGKQFNCRVNGVLIENCLSGGTVTGLSIRPGTGLASSPDPITSSGEIWLEDTAVTPGTYAYPTALAVDQQGRLTSITAGSSPALPCTSPSGSLQYDNSGNFGCATVGAGLLMTDGALTQTQTINNQSGGDYTVLTGDAAKTVLTGNHAYTLPQAGTTGFETGFGSCFLAAGASGGTLTTTSSIFSGAGDGSSLTFRSGDWACPSSDGSNWQTLVSFNYLGVASGLPMVGGGTGQPLAAGSRSGDTTQFATVTGSKTNGNLLAWDASGNAVDSGIATVGVGSGSVSSVAATAPSGLLSIGGSPITTSGTLAFSWAGTSGGVPYFSSATALASSGALAANGFVLGGGAGSAPTASQITGLIKGNGSSTPTAAVSGTDYAPATSGSAILKGNGSGGFSSAVASTDYAPATSGSAILKGNGSGGFSSAAAGTDYATATNGSASDILISNGSGGFGTAITPASGIATFLATPSGANLASALTSALTVGKGGTGLTGGTSGGILGFTGASTLASSGALTANMPVIGGGAGSTPTVGTVSGNTTQFVTTTGTQTSGRCVKIDANGNHVADSAACATGTLTASTGFAATGWQATTNPDKAVVFTAGTAATITDLRGTVDTAVGTTATISVFKAPSGTACSSGTNLVSAAGTFNANGTAVTNQSLTLAGSGAPSLSAGDRVCLSTSNGANFTAGSGIGGITVTYTVP